MATAPSLGAGTVRKEPLNYDLVNSNAEISDICCSLQLLTLAVGVREALKMYASLTSCWRDALAEKHRAEPAALRHVTVAPAPFLSTGRRSEAYMVSLELWTEIWGTETNQRQGD